MTAGTGEPGIGIVHLGVGAFHRAHQAVYTQAAMAAAGGNWGICGVSLRSPGVRDQLAGRHNNYTLVVHDNEEVRLQQITSIREMLVAPEDPGCVIDRLADPGVRLVTLTVTEKGYYLNPVSGELDRDNSELRRDLANIDAPVTTLGYLAAGLRRRRDAGGSGLTLLSCDNLSANGRKLQRALLDFSAGLDADLAGWIDQHCSFPCSVVDRIVPATTEQDREEVARQLGYPDPALVVTEPFSQWIIEDNFAGPVPAWNQADASFVADVEPFERLKLSLLNASHSAIAYLGSLSGLATVARAMEVPALRAMVHTLMQEMSATLHGLDQFDVAGYREALLSRFANRGLQHLTRQIAMDGSQKIPQRILPGLEAQLAAGVPGEATTLVLAAWIYYTLGTGPDVGEIDDPMAAEFQHHREQAGHDAQDYLARVLDDRRIIPPGLGSNEALRDRLYAWTQELDNIGALATLRNNW